MRVKWSFLSCSISGNTCGREKKLKMPIPKPTPYHWIMSDWGRCIWGLSIFNLIPLPPERNQSNSTPIHWSPLWSTSFIDWLVHLWWWAKLSRWSSCWELEQNWCFLAVLLLAKNGFWLTPIPKTGTFSTFSFHPLSNLLPWIWKEKAGLEGILFHFCPYQFVLDCGVVDR